MLTIFPYSANYELRGRGREIKLARGRNLDL